MKPFCYVILFITIFYGLYSIPAAEAQTTDQQQIVEQLKAQLEALKADYDKKIQDLQSQIEQLQVQMLGRGLRSNSDLILGLPGETLDTHLSALRIPLRAAYRSQ